MNKEKTLKSLQLTTGDFSSTIPPRTGYDRFFTSYLEKAEIPERYQGIASYRYADNPREKLWAMFFLHKNTDPSTGSPKDQFAHHLVSNTVDVGFIPKEEITDRDMRLLATAFQWLGTPVGHQQMIELLCSLPEYDRKYIIQRLQETL